MTWFKGSLVAYIRLLHRKQMLFYWILKLEILSSDLFEHNCQTKKIVTWRQICKLNQEEKCYMFSFKKLFKLCKIWHDLKFYRNKNTQIHTSQVNYSSMTETFKKTIEWIWNKKKTQLEKSFVLFIFSSVQCLRNFTYFFLKMRVDVSVFADESQQILIWIFTLHFEFVELMLCSFLQRWLTIMTTFPFIVLSIELNREYKEMCKWHSTLWKMLLLDFQKN